MEEKQWYANYPWRMVQTNLRETDMADLDAEKYAADLADFGATAVTLNAAGIIASYPTGLDFQTQSPYLTGAGLDEIITACHARGIKVIARTDFSKIREPIFAKHPEWAYRDKNGEIVNYNGNVQTCPNGEYQSEKALEILQEVLSKYDFDGVFCNMSGFLVVDYSGVYHGPCHCESCKRRFKEMFGDDMEIPAADDPRIPGYMKYAAFKGACTKAHKARLVETIRGVSPALAINGVDYIRTESNTDIGVAQWQYSASSNARLTAGAQRNRPADNASVDFIAFRYRDTSVSPACMALRQWQSLANAGSTSLYIMGRLDNHKDKSGFAPSKRAFDFHKKHEELFTHLTSAAEVVLVHRTLMARIDSEVSGFIKALTQSHIPFDEVKQNELTADTLKGKKAVILPDAKMLNPQQAQLIDDFAKGGGTVIATCDTGVKGDVTTLKCLGIKALVKREKALESSVFLAEDESFTHCKDAPYIAIGSSLVIAEYDEATQKYLKLIPEHPFGPPEICLYDEASIEDIPAVTTHRFGSGMGVYIPWLAGEFYFNEGYQNTLNFMADVLINLCGLTDISPETTPMAEFVLCRHVDGSTVVQLVNETGCYANNYFSPIKLTDIKIQLPFEVKTATALNGGTATVSGSTVTLDMLNEYEAIVLN